MTKHLRTKNTRVKLRIVSDEGLGAGSNESHKICENLEKWTPLSLSHIRCNTVNSDRTRTDIKVIWIYHSVKRINKSPT